MLLLNDILLYSSLPELVKSDHGHSQNKIIPPFELCWVIYHSYEMSNTYLPNNLEMVYSQQLPYGQRLTDFPCKWSLYKDTSNKAREVTWLVECWLSMHKHLGLIPSTTHKDI